MNLRKGTSIALSSLMLLSLLGCTNSSQEVSISGNYSIYVEGEDWGAGVNETTLTLDKAVTNVDKSDFKVVETKQTTDWNDETYPIIKKNFTRKITDAYSIDSKGQKTSKPSKKVIIKMNIDPDEGSPLLYSMKTQYNTWSKPYQLSFKLTKKSDIESNGAKVNKLNIAKKYTNKTTEADKLKINKFTNSSDKISLDYGLYVPKGKVNNVFVWLHGTGEGGGELKDTDPHVTALANEVTNELGDEFQNTVGNSAILVPQSPTIWQDATGNNCKWENGLPVIEGPSIYRDALMNLIKDTKEKTGASHVIIAGGSGGGYMTMAMLCAYPDQFDAAIPVCEAYPMDMIKDQDIENIKNIPMFFIQSKDDPSVSNDQFENPLIQKLKSAGASNLQVYNPDHVVDTSKKYNYLNDGKQYVYNGHWAWIYFHNNEAYTQDGTSVWQWIGNQVK